MTSKVNFLLCSITHAPGKSDTLPLRSIALRYFADVFTGLPYGHVSLRRCGSRRPSMLIDHNSSLVVLSQPALNSRFLSRIFKPYQNFGVYQSEVDSAVEI
jgi:hypothetical protein